MHKTKKQCNEIPGLENLDMILAIISSIEAWLIAMPAFYEVSEDFVPGIPADMQELTIDSRYLTDPKSRHCIGFWKPFSFISMDLVAGRYGFKMDSDSGGRSAAKYQYACI